MCQSLEVHVFTVCRPLQPPSQPFRHPNSRSCASARLPLPTLLLIRCLTGNKTASPPLPPPPQRCCVCACVCCVRERRVTRGCGTGEMGEVRVMLMMLWNRDLVFRHASTCALSSAVCIRRYLCSAYTIALRAADCAMMMNA